MTASEAAIQRLVAEIRACRICVEAPEGKPLPHAPRPVLRASTTARLAVCSQAPGTKVYRSGIPFSDRSGDRLREWMGVAKEEFYAEAKIAIVPMGFCFPGQDAKGADLPPRRECAPLWHRQLFAALPQIELVLAIGSYAQNGISATRRGRACRRRCAIGASICGGRRARVFCRYPIPPGATMPGSRRTTGSRRSCSQCCGAR
jgi:uracil-DNA glycosylase